MVKDNIISGLEIVQLKPGAFDKFRQYFVTDRKCTFNQMKIPRALKRVDGFRFFLKRALSEARQGRKNLS